MMFILIFFIISQTPIQITWDGWTDDLSGVNMYTFYVFDLGIDSRTGELTERNTNMSVYSEQVQPKAAFPTYTPKSMGMYTILLEVADKANNTMYARRLLLYDNTSSVSVNHNKMSITAAVGDTNHLWISTTQNESKLAEPIQVRWSKHFENTDHVTSKVLTTVSPFKSEIMGGFRYRFVSPRLDDNDGLRTLKSIENRHGIVRVQTVFKRDKDGGKTITQVPSVGWENAMNYLAEQASLNIPRLDGDSIRIWVKAYDVLDNSATDSILVHVDSSPPVIETPAFQKNMENGSYPFTSKYVFMKELNVLHFDRNYAYMYVHVLYG